MAAELDMPFMPWQQQVADVSLELHDDGAFAYREVDLTVPRQSGKTTLILAVILTVALAWRRQQIRYTAQTGADARKKWMDDWLPILESSKFARTFRTRKTNGHEALLFRNGSHQGLIATTKKSGHGGSVDLAILDEAFAHADWRLEQAVKPAMITRAHPQLWVVSTAGTLTDSPYLWSKVETGRRLVEAGVNEGTAYFEWSAADDADPTDEATWWSCMPALGRTTPVEAVRSDFETMELSEFKRAYLNMWVTSKSDPVISLTTWQGLKDDKSQIVGRPAFAFDVTPDRQSAAICAAGRNAAGKWHVEVVEHAAGTGWVAAKLAGVVGRHAPGSKVAYDKSSPAASLVPEVERLNVSTEGLSAPDHAKACGFFYDRATQDDLRHLGTADLVAALDGAIKRKLADSWAWSRASSNVDICPLVGVTLALWAAEAFGPVDVAASVW